MTSEQRPVSRTGPAAAATTQPDATVAQGADIVLSRHARRLKLDRVRRLRRISRELDRYNFPDPWAFSEPIDWHESYMDRGVPERDYAGRELAEVRWAP